MIILVRKISLALAALGLLFIATVVVGNYLGERKMQRVIEITLPTVIAHAVPARIEQGRYLFNTRGCADCHGADGAGREVFNEGALQVVAPNITKGAFSAVTAYQHADWDRTVRHGVKPDGRPAMIMPSEDYSGLSDDDLAALIGYVNQLAPREGRLAQVRLPVPLKVLYGFGAIEDASEMIDHAAAPPRHVAPAITTAHGAYVAHSCIGCHGAQLGGGRVPMAPSSWPPSARLRPGADSAMTRYPSAELFIAMLRSGQRPDGSAISAVMPFASLSQLNEVDARALHAYLLAMPPEHTSAEN